MGSGDGTWVLWPELSPLLPNLVDLQCGCFLRTLVPFYLLIFFSLVLFVWVTFIAFYTLTCSQGVTQE